MCKKSTYTVRFSNRGTNVFETVTRTTYMVNIPVELRNGKSSMITVLDGNIAIKSDNSTYHTHNELGVISNLPILGMDTEVESGHQSQNYRTLFSVDLTTYHTHNVNHPIKLKNKIGPYRCGALPEKFEFTRYVVDAGVVTPFDTGAGNSDFIDFTLSIEFDDENDK